jgi:hypothetical protein
MNAASPRLRLAMRRSLAFTALPAALLVSALAHAQADAIPKEPGSVAPPATPTAPSAPAPAAAQPVTIEQKLAAQQAAIDALIARTKDQDKAVAALRRQAASASDEAPTKLLSFWGFSDLTFGGIHYDSPTATYKVATPSHDTFYSGGVNLYVKSEMTRTLSALVETQLTYTPNGFTDNYPTNVYVGKTLIEQQAGTPVPNTTVHGPYSQLAYNQDGIVIERAYMEWKPADWFGVRVGRFLTPFGIWNEDHGSPVLIGVDYPQFMNFNLVPIQQLGLEAFGSANFTDDLRFEYALTFANSDGPAPEYEDLTNMKALGARLKFVYSHDDLMLRVGGYAYYSQYVNSTEDINVQLSPTLTINGVTNPFSSSATTSANYDESIFTGDAEVRYKGLRILGEFAHKTVIYNTASQLGATSQLLKGIPANATAYDTSHYGYGGYVMGAYEVPVRTKAFDFSMTPYLGYDYVIPSTTVETAATKQVRGGLNFKPSPYVTLKIEGSRILPQAQAVDSQGTAVFGQVAYSF